MPKWDSQQIDPAMLDAFEEQMTEDSFRSVLEEGRRDAALAQDAITDTLTGAARWNPAAGPLAIHLRNLIRSRAPRTDRDDADRPVTRREVFDLLDFTRVRLELAWRHLRDRARAARAARLASRAEISTDG